jgi:hypothetical protein
VSTIDAFFKASIIVGVLIASTSIAYYYVIYLPERDSKLDLQRTLEQISTDSAARLLKERQDAEKAAARDRYSRCTNSADSIYTIEWDQSCASYSKDQKEKHAQCLVAMTLRRTDCDSLYTVNVPLKDCRLPKAQADPINARSEKRKERCLEEFRAGIR